MTLALPERRATSDKRFVAMVLAFTALTIGLALVGAVRSYTAIPFWDMWDGYIGFYLDIKAGRYAEWFAQHNEHRIVLARLLFWIDLEWFQGLSWFLLGANYFLVGLSALTFWTILQELNEKESIVFARQVFGLVIVAILFSWMQEENLTQAFQSQFILAQLVPLLAFYWLHRSASGSRRVGHYLVAVFLGIASIGTMANGVMALPLMTAYGLYCGQGWKRNSILVLTSGATLLLYFNGYHAVEGHGSISRAFFADPSNLVLYVLLYLGSPAKYLLASRFFGVYLAPAAGLVFLAGCGVLSRRLMSAGRKSSLPLVLLFFIIYVLGTAVATAGGRLAFGPEQAMSSRYTTPVLMAWAALSISFSAFLIRCISKKHALTLLALVAFGVLVLRLQYRAVESKRAGLFEREVSALALELQVKDWQQIEKIAGPVSDLAFSYVLDADRMRVSVFGTEPLRGLRGELGNILPAETSTPCAIAKPRQQAIDGVTDFVRIGGPSDRAPPWPPVIIRILDSKGAVIGHAVGSESDLRPDPSGAALPAGSAFDGFVLSRHASDVSALRTGSRTCRF